MKRFLSYSKSLILMFAFGLMSVVAQGQAASPNEVSWGGSGFFVKKVVSNTSIPSGVNFSYTIIFSAPAGTPSISIQDVVPTTLAVVSIAPLSQVCGVTPVVNVSGQTVTYTLTGLPATCTPSGSFTIVVKFPEGVTCNGAGARNRVGIQVNGQYQYTEYVSTTATAVDPWIIGKSIVSGAVVNPSGGSCGYLIPPDGTVTYRLSIMKATGLWGNFIGQENMSGGVVTDILPTGAVFIGSTCGAIFTGTTITWNVGALNAANPWAYYYCDIQVKYPVAQFPNGSTSQNQATLTGTICQQPATHTSNITCVEVGQVTPNPHAYFQKYLALTNRVPGCQGYYQIVFCNNGNVPLTAFNINDVIPAGITVDYLQVYGPSAVTTVSLSANTGTNILGTNMTSTYTSANPIGFTVNNLSMQMTGSLPVGSCIYLMIYFTVNPNPTGTVVSNCATFVPLSTGLTFPPSCVDFTVQAGQPEPCLLKDICAPKTSYSPGDTVRFRVRVQNIGSANMTGASITDVLNSSFTYLGNESYFIANTYNPTCTTGSAIPPFTTAWTGVTPAHSGNNLSWSLPMVPSDCQLFYVGYCGYYGTWTLPYYYIEFDAVVSSSALPGVTPNNYTVSGGNLTATYTSNTVNVLIVASFGQEVEKMVSTDNGVTYATSGTVAPGGTARYQLKYKNTSNVPVTTVSLADLLGRDDGTNDWLILNRSIARGSQFDVSYLGAHTTTLLPVASPPTPLLEYANGLNICLPPWGISAGCNPVTWTTAPDRNIRIRYGTFILGPAKAVLEHFNVGIPTNAIVQQHVCNDFAGISTASFLLNGVPQSVALTPIAAAPVCLTVQPVVNCCDSIKITKVAGANCCARITTTCPVKSITVQVANGTIASVGWNCGTLPTGYVGAASYVFPANNCILDMNVCVNATLPGVTLTFIVNFSNGPTCDKVFQMDCKPAATCCDSVKLETVQGNNCCERIKTTCEVKALQVTVNGGNIASAIWNCGTLPTGFVGQSTFTFPANNCALDMTLCINAIQTSVSIDYVIYFTDGTTCQKSIKMDCKVTEDCCALIDFKLKSKWPFFHTLIGTFNITNLDPTIPICYVEILPTPAGTFTPGTLIVDGITSGQAWTSSRIPTTGNIFPAAVNSIKFNMVSSNYSGIIQICVVKCNGIRCCYNFKWNPNPLTGTDVSLNEISIGDKLVAVSISPVLKTDLPDSIKFVSFGLNVDSDITPTGPHFFAISGSGQAGDDFPEGLAVCDNTYMGSFNAFFELNQAVSSKDPLGAFHMVFTQKVPSLGCTLFDKNGNVLFTGAISVSGSSGVGTAVIEGGAGLRSGMFEFLNAYPNPSNGQFSLSFATGSLRDVAVQVIDTNGKILSSTIQSSNLPGIHTINLDVSSLPKGNYFVRLLSDGQVLSKSIVIQ